MIDRWDLGYGHITTKTIPGKIATILYSAFGVPLMMLFVANIGSTMAKMFAFVFSRIMMLFCCRMSAKKKRALALKNRQKAAAAAAAAAAEKPFPMPMKTTTTTTMAPVTTVVINEKPPPMEETRGYPANVRLNMLTGLSNQTSSRSLTSSTSSMTGDRSKDAIVRINELIRQESLQSMQENDRQPELEQRRRSAEFSPIEYYIKETNKLTKSLTDGTSMEKLPDEKGRIDKAEEEVRIDDQSF